MADARRIAAKLEHRLKVEILMRANEHEMNVDAGEERPVRHFERMVRLIDKGGRGGSRLSEEEWGWLKGVVDGMGPPP
jgi:hypothetical protein